MTYLTINDKTAEGKRILADLKKSKAVKILHSPNEETKQALRDAKVGIGVKPIKDTRQWLNKLLG